MSRLYYGYLKFRPFTDHEAWLIFKLAAYLEAIGWTLLIGGILVSKYLTPHSTIAVQIAGHMHGTLFILYIAAVAVASPSLHWKPVRIILAGLMSVPPYGTLFFEFWQSHLRQRQQRQYLIHSSLAGLIKNH
ncbi:MAG TPA: DUF3817 domain-containing protein [Candidatus Saccharimonadales bacterium]|nr:DUF3817 domain-containing protein [Candidatus Saccharimonadales bacterium]